MGTKDGLGTNAVQREKEKFSKNKTSKKNKD
jgi:hypothetical protein